MNNDKAIEDIAVIMKIQGADETLFSSEYNLGLFNGLEIAMSLIQNREPEFKGWPENRPRAFSNLFHFERQKILDICLRALSEASGFSGKDDCNGIAGELAKEALSDIRRIDPVILMRPIKGQGEVNG